MAFHVGQKVVCIKRGAWVPLARNETPPKYGETYTVRGIDIFGDGFVGLFLTEIVNPKCHYAEGYREASWLADRFRPLIEHSTDTGMAILKKIAQDAGGTVIVEKKKRVREAT